MRAIAINATDSPIFTVQSILGREVLNYASLSDNSNKFYILELQTGIGGYPYRIYTEYGRVGKNPRKEARYYRSRWEAEQDFYKIKDSKESKGYEKIDIDDGTGNSCARISVTPKKQDLSTINDKVLKLIGKLYNNATDYLVKSIDTPLGKLSANQVAKGLDILNQIEKHLNRKDASGMFLERLSNDFYSIIPMSFGHKVNYDKFIINDFVKLNDRKDLLGVMESVVKAQNTLEKTLDEKYKSLNIKLKALSSRTKDYKRIVDYITSSQSGKHNFKIKVQDIFEVEDMVGHDKFNPYKVSTMELFHGTRNENILSIMQSGLKIKPSSAVHSGSMFGSGIYFANQSSKSANYCWGFGSATKSDNYYLFLCEVATGKVKEYDSAQPNLSKAPNGYNSVLGKKGPSLLHDEYIVYKDSQVKIKYIVEFAKN